MNDILGKEIQVTISNSKIAYLEQLSVVKNSDKEKQVFNGYVITFDSASSWSFDNESAKNVIIFGVDNSSSSHADNRKNIFLVLGEGLIFGINGGFGSAGKKELLLILVKQTQNFA